ncbi:hypothetical protein VT84_13800 [Gemmata sp. SH-PL17]|uniref:hypothetical protein n=1 Tax=Gemmata sp. SH-PL17 TaxID=1630693 RepID=UPI00078C92CE|nr:hypothetical protein [Gemmata sp. SH-PL17]AMV25467.1 hypothetical protein VT84_13800 [Gemmata sp. SH-PL17]
MRAYFGFLRDLWYGISVVLMTGFAAFVLLVAGMALVGIRLDAATEPAPTRPLTRDATIQAELDYARGALVKERAAHTETQLQLDIVRRTAIWFPPKPMGAEADDLIPATRLPTIPECQP